MTNARDNHQLAGRRRKTTLVAVALTTCLAAAMLESTKPAMADLPPLAALAAGASPPAAIASPASSALPEGHPQEGQEDPEDPAQRRTATPQTAATLTEPKSRTIELQVAPIRATATDMRIALTHTGADRATSVIGNLTADAHGQVHVQRSWCQPRDPDASVCVDAGFPTAGAYAQPVDPACDTLQMSLPELGRLRIELLEADGSPVRELAVAEVQVLTAAPPADRQHRYEVVGGNVEFAVECSELLLELRIATLAGRSARPQTVIGPRMPGQVQSVAVHLAPRSVFTARLLDPIGQPLAHRSVEVRLAGTSLQLEADPETDQHGVVRIPQPARFTGQPWRLWFLAESADGRSLHGELLADLAPASVARLGDVWLNDSEVVVAGVCVDELGAPLPGVTLKLQSEVPEGDPSARLFGTRWRDVAWGATRTREDGTFEIRGPKRPEAPLRLQARGRPGAVTALTRGETNVRFQLRDPAPRRNG